jgi:hypothetical protein
MANSHQIAVSPVLNSIFAIAKTKYHDRHIAWTNFFALLAERFSLPIATIGLQRQGDLDLLLWCMEDEYETNKAAQTADGLGVNFAFHYQIMLSESWVVGCYEILRAFRQRDRERKLGPDAVSNLSCFKTLFADLELLRMPIAKYEVAKDFNMRQPLPLVASQLNDDTTDNRAYSKDDPARSLLMQTGLSDRGSAMWLAIDHFEPRQYWIERRSLSDRLLALGNEIVPAGILEAQRAAAGTARG